MPRNMRDSRTRLGPRYRPRRGPAKISDSPCQNLDQHPGGPASGMTRPMPPEAWRARLEPEPLDLLVQGAARDAQPAGRVLHMTILLGKDPDDVLALDFLQRE
jgi:hypothetical protein